MTQTEKFTKVEEAAVLLGIYEAIPGRVAQATDEDLARQTAEIIERIRQYRMSGGGWRDSNP